MTAPLHDPPGVEDAGELSDGERREAIRRLQVDIALARNPELTALEMRLYKHVVDCIDFDALFQREQMLWFEVERLGHGALDNRTGLSHRLIERALVRAALDPCNTFSDVPFGITKAEQRAVRFDADCGFCQWDEDEAAQSAPTDDAGNAHDDESCPCCDAMAREWRAKHADALRAAADRRAARDGSHASQRTVAGSRTARGATGRGTGA